MDTREDRYFYGLEQADRPRPRYIAEQTARFNALMAEKDAHRSECPMGQVGKISTLCVCREISTAENCERCHSLVMDCRCDADKRQWV